MARQAIYDRETGEVIGYVGSRREAREVAKEFPPGEIETQENVFRRKDAVRRIKDEHGRDTWSIGSNSNQSALDPTRDRIGEALAKYTSSTKITVAIRGRYGDTERWYGSTGTVDYYTAYNVKVPGETFAERVERLFLGTEFYKLQEVYQLVFMIAHE